MGSSLRQRPVFSLLDSSSSMALIPVGLWGSTFDLTSDGSLLILPTGLWQRSELLLEDHFCGVMIKSAPLAHPTIGKHLIPCCFSLLRLP